MRQALVFALLLLAACGPIPRAQAEKQCLHDARLTEHPRGLVGVGMGSDGRAHLVGDVTISSDFLQGRDPSQVYDNCVFKRSGEMPSRPYTSIPASQN